MGTTMETLTIRAGGGGQSSTIANDTSLLPFSESVLSHLVLAYKDARFQDGQNFFDQSEFLSYMASGMSSAMAAPKNNDLSYPLSSYFISSSHNTYLSGHQLYGEASVDGYKNVLRRGCRCLEIDVWDGDCDSDTSSSSDEDEQGSTKGRKRSDSKPSRWNRVKARASRMRSRSRSGSQLNNGPVLDQVPAAHAPGTADGAAADRSAKGSSLSPNYLAPQPSASSNPRSEPRVLHGYTLTQPITFRSVCESIKETAFLTNDLPLIVSLEVHASLSQQEIMVDIVREVWSGLLVDIDRKKDISVLPSPESLKRTILIKVKWTTDPDTGESVHPVDQVESNSTQGSTGATTTSSSDKKKKASKILAALSHLGVYTRAYSFKHFKQPEASIPSHVFSLSENKVLYMHSDPYDGPALFDHNKKYLMRVFPKGTRISSSNTDPTFHWRQGAQMVALNWQKLDKGMMLNEGMFAGTKGWVLKPEGYRCNKANSNEANAMDRATTAIQPKKQYLDLEIRLLAAQRLPLPAGKDTANASRMKPYVKFQLHVDTHGPPGQGKGSTGLNQAQAEMDSGSGDEPDEKYYKRRSATSKSDSPDFCNEKISWLGVSEVEEELSFLRVKVMDDRSISKDDLLAWACIRLDRLQPGYRFIHLLDSTGMPSRGALLVHVSKILV
ncbi:1-phosphatidylinositol 4,5-bisphosphate phosphodiesterase 1 [Exophiala dermatitidis]